MVIKWFEKPPAPKDKKDENCNGKNCYIYKFTILIFSSLKISIVKK